MGKKKKIKKAIRSLERRIKEHKKKILEYGGKKDYLRDYWRKEVTTYKKKKEELDKKLQKE